MFTKKLFFVMHISIQNLGIIQSAELALNGITVLAGYNDSGKSFIGKLIFAIFHTIKNAESSDAQGKEQQFAYNLNRIDLILLRINPPTSSPSRTTVTETNAVTLSVKLRTFFEANGFQDPNRLLSLLEDYKQQLLREIENFDENNSRVKKDQLQSLLKDIEIHFTICKKLITDKTELETLFIRHFQNVIIPEIFEGNINSLHKSSVLEVKIIEGSTIIVSITVEQNRIKSFKYNPDVNPGFTNDATLIETPTVLSLDKYYYLIGQPSIREKELPLAYRDLLNKMRNKYDVSFVPHLKEIITEIEKIIGGGITYSTTEKEFVFKKENDHLISSSNIATGIKAFALLEMLIKNGHLTPDTILILDEPEVHLHPAWEILYAQILFSLCKAGVKILLATHSGYFIQAISEYSVKMEMESSVNFYFGEKNPNSPMTLFVPVSNELEPIFKALSKPMRDIFK